MFRVVKNRIKGTCCAHGCLTKATKDRFCSKHRKRYTREVDPAAYYFEILRSNAKRRKKEFTLKLHEFREFCESTSYLELKGERPKSLTIDRINHIKGYSFDNIQVLTLSENVRKHFEDIKAREIEDDLPF
jgi:hypothetical protein